MIVSEWKEHNEQWYGVEIFFPAILAMDIQGNFRDHIIDTAWKYLSSTNKELNRDNWVPFVFWTDASIKVLFG